MWKKIKSLFDLRQDYDKTVVAEPIERSKHVPFGVREGHSEAVSSKPPDDTPILNEEPDEPAETREPYKPCETPEDYPYVPDGMKPDRTIHRQTISFFFNEAAPRGKVVVYDYKSKNSCDASGCLPDDPPLARLPTSPKDQPIGILLNDVVNLDLTRQHINWHTDEIQVGGKVQICDDGIVSVGVHGNPRPGDLAYFMPGGSVTTESGSTVIGQFLSSKDEDGYAQVKIRINPGHQDMGFGRLDNRRITLGSY